MKSFFSIIILLLVAGNISAQNISLSGSWKFHTGDDSTWASPEYNDQSWKTIPVKALWENQGYKDYNGYAWYRRHIVIPSSIKANAYLKKRLKIELGKIDDGDQVYLNGKKIGQNAGDDTPIEKGDYSKERIYSIPLDDSAIRWDRENVIAVRVYDHGGGGGMYAGTYQLGVKDVPDYLSFDLMSNDFYFPAKNIVSKKIILSSSYSQSPFTGNLTIKIVDPEDSSVIWSKSTAATVSANHSFYYTFRDSLPAQKTYNIEYTFTDDNSNKSLSAKEGIPYILTPPAPKTPRINGARVYGARPGHPFLFKVPATGKGEITYGAKNLPQGLSIDPANGVIKGVVDNPGTYEVELSAISKFGKDKKPLKIVIGDTIALTPAMGWNSWNVWGTSVNADKVEAAADAMIKSGLIDHGWSYINIDDGWERETRAADGSIVTNNKFPDMAAVADYVHNKGMKLGIYSSPGPKTCGGFLGSYQHEKQDAETYANWGIDYLKYDWCSYGTIAPANPDLAEMQKPYIKMRSELDAVNRDILFSLCQYGMGDVWRWGAEVGGNSWRTTGDITDTWQSMSTIGFGEDTISKYAEPGHWNDPDMLVVGKVGWGPSLHDTHLSPDEQYTHISLWCMLAAPLLIGCDMSQMTDFTKNLLSNDEVLAIDQDALGKAATKVAEIGDFQIWERPLADGSKAVGIFNLGEASRQATVNFADLHLNGSQKVRDLWRQKDLGTFNNDFSVKVPSHGVVLVKIKGAS